MPLTRRRLLATGASLSLAGLAGCFGLLEKKPLLLRATPATAGATEDTDVQCQLTKRFVSNHPKLETVLRAARTNQPGSWAKTGVTEERASTITDALRNRCGKDDLGGLYQYDGDWFYISIIYRQASDHDHSDHSH